ncbi:Endo-1,3(4)-beta-glucanase [Lachnellula hyalina]|uniref:endo-1,3(4)-beta-glucanase n=1 Tax=Lachnellula hyalina TaxID=1316788 RepID=A0A8H8R0M6_9HELO|nr:Endo-1,3(4)-beta-glucanase [Lachnellula hyalina]TVY25906.1 Endo-1,3(4)-beta-glucanase [Lachnellula hyalina]
MHTSNSLIRLSAALCLAAGTAKAYTLTDTFDKSNFFQDFNFFTAADPTTGFVKYVGAAAANTSGLAGYSNNAVYLGVDHTTMNPTGGRESVRVTSNKAYTHGLFVADLAHAPDSECGVWPAFWTVGPNWPASGEIDIMEGISDSVTNSATLHTSSGCTMQSTGALASSKLNDGNCSSDTGCGMSTNDTSNYGTGFNAAGGGVYAMEWTSQAIKVFFFPRAAGIPSDITSGSPNPTSWSSPIAAFSGSGCNIDQHFMNHNLIFDTTFCGQWAGKVWSQNTKCSALAPTCDAYVAANPAKFASSYWLINSVKVYQASAAKRGVAFEA